MKYALYLVMIMLLIGLLSCSGEDNPDKDKIPPFPPTLIPHLGDTGDPPVQGIVFNDENNGIDTVPDGNWIRVLWKPFIDTDLSHVKIFRYNQFNTTPVLIDSIPSYNNFYVDSRTQLNERVRYSYFIDLVDVSGNVARSDTVSYALLGKSILLTPGNNATISPVGATFMWNRSGFASSFRLLILNENDGYVYHQDLVVSTEEDPLFLTFPTNLAQEYSGQSLRWRIDSFDWDEEMQMFMGSESIERIVHIQ
ncbi:MAG: hypothetical protein Q8M98_04980 [Candidatus Cloacimonadaceae bacterium]|nr:hypothetical protein [Candidatus Cloacimonadaceae bacterium]MDP3114115.1 hypothetical protein [Candidatus Cloacimonadaceae bacterium]